MLVTVRLEEFGQETRPECGDGWHEADGAVVGYVIGVPFLLVNKYCLGLFPLVREVGVFGAEAQYFKGDLLGQAGKGSEGFI